MLLIYCTNKVGRYHYAITTYLEILTLYTRQYKNNHNKFIPDKEFQAATGFLPTEITKLVRPHTQRIREVRANHKLELERLENTISNLTARDLNIKNQLLKSLNNKLCSVYVKKILDLNLDYLACPYDIRRSAASHRSTKNIDHLRLTAAHLLDTMTNYPFKIRELTAVDSQHILAACKSKLDPEVKYILISYLDQLTASETCELELILANKPSFDVALFYRHITGRDIRQLLEQHALNTPITAYQYARFVVKQPRPTGETLLAQSAEPAARYALAFIKKP